MDSMPRPRPKHLHRQFTRHGKAVWYVRVGKGKRTRIKSAFGTPEFEQEYQAAITGEPLVTKQAKSASLQWLYERYRETSAWRDLSLATRRQRENILSHVMKASGSQPFVAITKKHVTEGRDRRSGTPAQARNFLDAMRGMFRWALGCGYVAIDPTEGVKNPKRKKGKGFPEWNEEDVTAYEKRWPVGTKERVWLNVLMYTGLRRGDAVIAGKQHVRDGIATINTEKSGEMTEVSIPILPALAEALKRGPTGDLAWICGTRGEPLTKESFGNAFSAAARAAGVNKSAHGVRKIGATRAANNGATEAELEAIFGWHGGGMAALYTRSANRRRLAKQAIEKLNRPQTAIPSPNIEVRDLKIK